MRKSNKGLAGILLAGASVLGLAGNSDGGTIKVADYTSSGGIGMNYLYAKNISGASEGYDNNGDVDFLSSPQTNALEIYTQVEGNKLSTDARPIDTTGWDFDLGVKGNVNNINNSLKFIVTDTTDLVGKDIFAYDKANPNNKYTIPHDGSTYTINLPNLTHGAGEYAHWRLDITPEPSTLGLLALGAGLLLSRRRRGMGTDISGEDYQAARKETKRWTGK